MTVTIQSPVMGLAVGASYTGPEEAWLLVEGYARRATPIPYADPYSPTVGTAGAVVGSADAVNIVTGGNLVVEVDGHNRYAIALAAADTPAAVVTKVNAVVGSVATASLVSGDFQLASDSTGSLSSVKVISGTGTVLANLSLIADQFAKGTDGNDNQTDYTGDVTVDGFLTLEAGGKAAGVLPVSDPTLAANREAPGEIDGLPYSATLDGNADGDTLD